MPREAADPRSGAPTPDGRVMDVGVATYKDEMGRHPLRLGRIAVLAAVVAGLSACRASSAPTRPTGFAFGTGGGNIVPYHVLIEPTGVIRASGTRTRRRALSRAEAASLSRLVHREFSAGMKSRRCHGTNPDIASHFIRADDRTVTVHGNCEPRFQRLWNTLARAVGIDASAP
jgi:hypothetical protein